MSDFIYRSAEKKRKLSSLPIADHVATLSVQAYKLVCPSELLECLKQTVISTVVLEIQNEPAECGETHLSDTSPPKNLLNSEFVVLSIGVGTKILSKLSIEKERSAVLNGDRILRDLHAEVLAKRGFHNVLYAEIQRFLKNEMDATSTSLSSSYSTFLQRDQVSRLLQFKLNYKLHFYTSSAPCGNACIRRWAKCVNYKSPDMAFLPHERLFVTAAAQGQVSPLLKTNGSSSTSGRTLPFQDLGDSLFTDGIRVFPTGTAPGCYPDLGNVMTCSDKIAKWNVLGIQGSLLGCFLRPTYFSSIVIGRKYSEAHAKRALCCRLQDFHYNNGNLLLPGKKRKRKESEHPQQAEFEVVDVVKLRVDEEPAVFANSLLTNQYSVHHPIIHGTSVKLDEGAVVVKKKENNESLGGNKEQDNPATGVVEVVAGDGDVVIGANFQERRCFVAWYSSDSWSDEIIPGNYQQEVLDSQTGLVLSSSSTADSDIISSKSGSISAISSHSFHKDFLELCKLIDSKTPLFPSDLSYKELKKINSHYSAAKDILYNHEVFFNGEWIQKDR
jgi:hypothetical protein